MIGKACTENLKLLLDRIVVDKGKKLTVVFIAGVAQEVIDGKWGNGERLTAAGYDYYAVQRRVNEMLK